MIHKLSAPQTSAQVEVLNRQIKLILEKTVSQNRKYWFSKLVDVLWAYMPTFKMILDISPYRLVFEKTCHLSFELKHRALWAIMKLNFDLDKACALQKL